jgi:four helix bundle protein
MHPYRKLVVWQKAHALALDCYRAAWQISERRYPTLGSQIRRAAASIPANIVEGSSHESSAQFARFFATAHASANELDYHLLFASDLGAMPRARAEALQVRVVEVRRMLAGLMRRLRSRDGPTESGATTPEPDR